APRARAATPGADGGRGGGRGGGPAAPPRWLLRRHVDRLRAPAALHDRLEQRPRRVAPVLHRGGGPARRPVKRRPPPRPAVVVSPSTTAFPRVRGERAVRWAPWSGE